MRPVNETMSFDVRKIADIWNNQDIKDDAMFSRSEGESVDVVSST